MNINPEKLISALRSADFYIECIFMQGSCYKFYLFLSELYASAQPMIHKNKDHVVTSIAGELYDITGKIPLDEYKDYSPLSKEDLEIVSKWSFSNHCFLQLGECPQCEEPLIYEP